MASFFIRAKNFLAQSDIRKAYFYWLRCRLKGQLATITLPGGGRAGALGRFNDFYAIWVQHPQEAEMVTYRELLGPGGLYVDVGANMGLTSILASSTGVVTEIVAFEPTHAYAASWHHNIHHNQVRNATLLQCAVSDKAGKIEFVINPTGPMHNRINSGDTLHRYVDNDPTQRVDRIVAVTLDEVAGLMGWTEVALLKIDVEGAEPLVLKGAEQLLRRKAIRALLIEFIPEFMREMGHDLDAYVAYIRGFGYEFYRIEENGKVGTRMTPDEVVQRKFAGLNVAILPVA